MYKLIPGFLFIGIPVFLWYCLTQLDPSKLDAGVQWSDLSATGKILSIWSNGGIFSCFWMLFDVFRHRPERHALMWRLGLLFLNPFMAPVYYLFEYLIRVEPVRGSRRAR
jgi:hypothetical protein